MPRTRTQLCRGAMVLPMHTWPTPRLCAHLVLARQQHGVSVVGDIHKDTARNGGRRTGDAGFTDNLPPSHSPFHLCPPTPPYSSFYLCPPPHLLCPPPHEAHPSISDPHPRGLTLPPLPPTPPPHSPFHLLSPTPPHLPALSPHSTVPSPPSPMHLCVRVRTIVSTLQ
ncbi:unnamed protein product [Closterium sp. Naga37s-1]|nr:unnamed protein product [Closterium sp. Naga37s-1]